MNSKTKLIPVIIDIRRDGQVGLGDRPIPHHELVASQGDGFIAIWEPVPNKAVPPVVDDELRVRDAEEVDRETDGIAANEPSSLGDSG
jgi:hypothetical protein